jgi:hypothetical protein
MSHWNPLENQLRSWTPRAPSPSLKARLFGQPQKQEASAAAQRRREPAAWHWLAPAMAVFVFGLFIYGSNGALHHYDSDNYPSALAAAALTQPDYSTYYASVRHSGNNALRSTFEWTNESHSLKTAPPMAQTNSVIQ